MKKETETTKASEHTPGPWKYRYEGSGDYEVYSEAGNEIGTAWSKDAHFLGLGTEAERNEANARLIAASPTMHAYILERAEQGDLKAESILDTLK